MLVISAVSIFLLATAAYLVFRRPQNEMELNERRGDIVRVGIQIICGDCCGDSDRPVKTYLDRFGRCGQCGGRAYVLASAYAPLRRMDGPPEFEEARSTVRHQPAGPQVRLHAVRVLKIGA